MITTGWYTAVISIGKIHEKYFTAAFHFLRLLFARWYMSRPIWERRNHSGFRGFYYFHQLIERPCVFITPISRPIIWDYLKISSKGSVLCFDRDNKYYSTLLICYLRLLWIDLFSSNTCDVLEHFVFVGWRLFYYFEHTKMWQGVFALKLWSQKVVLRR